MGFWKKLGTIVGRVAVQAGIGALEAKASGKPITIGTVGPGVLGDVLKRSEEPEEKESPQQKFGVMFNERGPDGSFTGRVRYFTDVDLARRFATSMGTEAMQAVETEQGTKLVPIGKG